MEFFTGIYAKEAKLSSYRAESVVDESGFSCMLAQNQFRDQKFQVELRSGTILDAKLKS